MCTSASFQEAHITVLNTSVTASHFIKGGENKTQNINAMTKIRKHSIYQHDSPKGLWYDVTELYPLSGAHISYTSKKVDPPLCSVNCQQ